MKTEVTEEQFNKAVDLMIAYAHDMNSGRAHPGDWRVDITEAHEIAKNWGFSAEYRFEDGKQYLYVGGVKRS